MILVARLPIQLGKERQVIAAARPLPKIGMDGVEGIGDLLQVDGIVRTAGNRRRAERSGTGNGALGAGNEVPGATLVKSVSETDAYPVLITEIGAS